MNDGQQRMSDWPKEIVAYLDEHPNDAVICSQSVHFENKKSYRRKGVKLFVSYNKNKQVFTAWNVWVHFRDSKREAVFSLKKVVRYSLRLGTHYIDAGIVNGRQIYEKVCIIPESEFLDFYRSYAEKMEPSVDDKGYHYPVFSFLNENKIIEEKGVRR